MSNLIEVFGGVFQIIIIIVLIILGGITGYYIGKFISNSRIKEHRQDAVKRSRNSILGEVYEKIIPFLNNFEYSPKDMVFIGKGFDYLILDGLSSGNLKEIIFMEVKYGSGSLNKNEKMIRQIVGSKKVRYTEYRIPKINS